MTERESQAKAWSNLIPRAIACLIDSLLITAADCALMYAIWLIGMASGFLDSSPDHWYQILLTAPLFLADGLTVLVMPVSLVYINSTAVIPEQTETLANSFFVLAILINWLYHALFESSSSKATPGMMAMGLKVEGEGGAYLSFIAASIRHFSKVLSVALLFIGFLPIFGKNKNRTLQCLLSRSKLVHEG